MPTTPAADRALTERSGRLMAVQAGLVREHLVGRIVAEAETRFPGDPPESVGEAMDQALELVAGPERAGAASDESRALAAALCRLGYLARAAETEMFEPARAKMPWLADTLAKGGDASNTATEVSAKLALEEPGERPDPESGAASWRVPGPGGHVRHYAAIEAIARRAPTDADGNPRLGQGIRSPAELKRCWLLGFFLRCSEEAAPRPPA